MSIRYAYHFGIIDFLTRFTCLKKGESIIKQCFFGKGVSCVPAKIYANRFDEFVTNNVFKSNLKKKSNITKKCKK